MNTLRFFRKPHFSLFFSFLILFTACNETELSEIQQNSILQNSSLTSREATQYDVDRILELETEGLKNESNPDNNFDTYNKWLSTNNLSIKYLGFSESSDLKKSMTNTLAQNFEDAKNSGNYSVEEITVLDKFYANLTVSTSTKTFADVIAEFKSDVSQLTLSPAKRDFYDAYFTALNILNKVHPEIYIYTEFVANTNRCILATAGLVVAFGGLATIEVGSFGAATGFAVAGWFLACAAWGRECA